MNIQTAPIGHNHPPLYDIDAFEALKARVQEIADAGGDWLDLGKIETEEKASKLNDFIGQSRKTWKEVDEARKAAKQPHLDAGREVDTAFKALADPIENLVKKLKKPLADFAAEQQRILDEQRRKEREAAAKAAAEAEEARRAAEARNDVLAQAEAEKAAKEAAKATKAAERPAKANIASATGGGRTMSTRTVYTAQIQSDGDARRAFGFLLADPDSREALVKEMERLATAARRRKDGPTVIPGITFNETQTVA